jgi:lipopolysaccharide export system protein LptA
MIKIKNITIIISIFFTSIGLLYSSDGTFWKGSSQINAKSNSLSIYEKGNKIVLKGKCSIARQDTTIYSDIATIFQKEKYFTCNSNVISKRTSLNGDTLTALSDELTYNDASQTTEMINVKNINYIVVKDSGIANGKCDTLFYDDKKQYGIMKGCKDMQYYSKAKDEFYTVKGNIVETFDNGAIIKLKENVELNRKEGDYVITSGEALYDKAKKYILFTKKPMIRQVDNDNGGICIYKGDKIYYYPDTKKSNIEGSVKVDWLPNK